MTVADGLIVAVTDPVGLPLDDKESDAVPLNDAEAETEVLDDVLDEPLGDIVALALAVGVGVALGLCEAIATVSVTARSATVATGEKELSAEQLKASTMSGGAGASMA